MTRREDARPHHRTGTQRADESRTRTVHRRYDAGLRRRYDASLRLPPLECGCRDPQSYEHLTYRCRYRKGAAR